MTVQDSSSSLMPFEGYVPVRLPTGRGDVDCRYYAVPDTCKGAIWVGGAGGGWDTPAQGLYPRLCEDLRREGVASLRVRFRDPTDLEEAVADVLAGIRYLEGEGIEAIALTGHSFGGAVVIQAAAREETVRAAITLATQSYGAGPADRLAPRCALLLLHGTADRVLPPSSSEHVHGIAGDPKELRLFDGAGHGLDEVAEDVHRTVRQWIIGKLTA